MTYPETFRYTKEHEWISVEGGVGAVGITDEAQKLLGEITFVGLPENGATAEAGKAFGTVDSVKAANDIFAPVSGEIIEVNRELENAPEILNQDPHGAGWIVKIRLSDPSELDALLDAAGYQAYIAG